MVFFFSKRIETKEETFAFAISFCSLSSCSTKIDGYNVVIAHLFRSTSPTTTDDFHLSTYTVQFEAPVHNFMC